MNTVDSLPSADLVALASAQLLVLVCDCSGIDRFRLQARHGHWLSADEQVRLQRFGRPQPATLFLAGRVLLRGSLAALLGCAPAAPLLGENAWGKPTLQAPVSPWQFNLSHSHGWLALALSRVGAVGVDTEYGARVNDLSALARRYFSADEQGWLAEVAVDASAWRQRFFDVWTLKEAYIKAIGQGLAVSLDGFSFTADDARLQYRYQAGVAPSGPVQAWLSRAIADRPLACVAVPDRPWSGQPALVQVDLDGRIQRPLAWSAQGPHGADGG